MTAESLAQPTRESTRVDRGRELYRDRYNEIEHLEGDVWSVPSGNLLTGSYLVRLGERPACECKDFEYRRVQCYHQVAAQIAETKSRPCSCCRRRVQGRFLSEVIEEDGLLSWFVGDELCSDCVRDGYWV